MRNLTVGDGNSPPFADPLHGGQEPALKRQIRHVPRWDADRGAGPNDGVLPVSSLHLGSRPGISVPQAAAAREEQARLERLCGISRGPGCGTLLLYSRPDCSNYVPDQWS
jgi:hypothetical protein